MTKTVEVATQTELDTLLKENPWVAAIVRSGSFEARGNSRVVAFDSAIVVAKDNARVVATNTFAAVQTEA